MTEEKKNNSFEQLVNSVEEKLAMAGMKFDVLTKELRDNLVDASGDVAEIVLQKLDEAMEVLQEKIRDVKKTVDEKTEKDKPE